MIRRCSGWRAGNGAATGAGRRTSSTSLPTGVSGARRRLSTGCRLLVERRLAELLRGRARPCNRSARGFVSSSAIRSSTSSRWASRMPSRSASLPSPARTRSAYSRILPDRHPRCPQAGAERDPLDVAAAVAAVTGGGVAADRRAAARRARSSATYARSGRCARRPGDRQQTSSSVAGSAAGGAWLALVRVAASTSRNIDVGACSKSRLVTKTQIRP